MNNSLTSGQYRAERSLKRICLHEARRKGSHVWCMVLENTEQVVENYLPGLSKGISL